MESLLSVSGALSLSFSLDASSPTVAARNRLARLSATAACSARVPVVAAFPKALTALPEPTLRASYCKPGDAILALSAGGASRGEHAVKGRVTVNASEKKASFSGGGGRRRRALRGDHAAEGRSTVGSSKNEANGTENASPGGSDNGKGGSGGCSSTGGSAESDGWRDTASKVYLYARKHKALPVLVLAYCAWKSTRPSKEEEEKQLKKMKELMGVYVESANLLEAVLPGK